MVDQVALQRRMSSCFNGVVQRDCSNCPGHHTQTARCCFGHRFDPDDQKECGECRHQVDCQQETRRYELTQAHRVGYSSPQPYAAQTPRIINPANTVNPPVIPSNSPDRIPVGSQAVQETAFERFLKDSIWSALEGFFHGALGFFRMHRWR